MKSKQKRETEASQEIKKSLLRCDSGQFLASTLSFGDFDFDSDKDSEEFMY